MAEIFPSEVVEKLKNYVYRLIDPRNGETFYVGRGVGNRLYAHIHDELGSEKDEVSDKLRRIREIRLAGFDVAHVVHRHGMDPVAATEVEAALIDAYPGLTNIVGGEGSGERGAMHANEIVREYRAEQAEFKHRALLISVNRSASERPLYEATRYAWKLSQQKVREAEIVLASEKGIIRAAYIPEQWLEATAQNFPGRADRPGRLGFIGKEAPIEIQNQYVGRRIPDEYRFGTANPIRYTWKRVQVLITDLSRSLSSLGRAKVCPIPEALSPTTIFHTHDYSMTQQGWASAAPPTMQNVNHLDRSLRREIGQGEM